MSKPENECDELTVTQEKFKPFKSGIYELEVSEVTSENGKWKPILCVIFEVAEEGELKGRKVRGIVNRDLSINGNLWQLYRALTGVSLKKGEKINPQDLIGKRCCADVENRGKFNAITEYIDQKNLAGIERDGIEG